MAALLYTGAPVKRGNESLFEMNCPNCGSDRIHRSRRKGLTEAVALTLFAIFPFRCSACRARFHRYRPHRRSDASLHASDPPEWLRPLIWAAIVVGGVAASVVL